MYFFNNLDRSNLGNAKTDGLDKDFGLVRNQYSIVLTVFSVTFCSFDLPSNLLLKRFSGRRMLPLMMIGWLVLLSEGVLINLAELLHRGSVTLLQCSAHNFAGLLVCRLFMGMFEAGFFGKCSKPNALNEPLLWRSRN